MMRCGVCGAVTAGGELCVACTAAVFPFTALESTQELISYWKENFGPLSSCEVENNTTLNLTDQHEGEYTDLLTDFDPDVNYMNAIQANNLSSKYYDEDKFNTDIKAITENDRFALLHLNSRSVPKNLQNLPSHLQCLDMSIDVIGPAETWINKTNKNLYSMKG